MSTDSDQVVEEFTRPVIKLILALISLFVLRFIITSLPGLDTPIPDMPITFSLVAGAVITLIMVAIIVNFGREIEPRISRVLTGPQSVTDDLANATKFLVFLLGILIAYDGLSGVIVPFLVPDPGAWIYDIIFLLVALVPTIIVAQRMFNNLDEITDILAEQVKSATVNEVTCSECGNVARASLDFCPNCGNDLADESTSQPDVVEDESPNTCPECSADVDTGMAFCGNCGANLA